MQHALQPSLFPQDEAREILRRRKRRKSGKHSLETKLCAVIASLPTCVKVKDVAKLFNIPRSTLTGWRTAAAKGTMPIPASLDKALKRSFIPKG